MKLDDILKNQITSTKQGILTSDAPLPKKKKRDCNKILREMSEDLNILFELEVEQIIKKRLEVLGSLVDSIKRNDGQNALPIWRKQEEDIKISKGTVKSATLKFGRTQIRCAFSVRFVPFDDEDMACRVLDDMKKLRYGLETGGGEMMKFSYVDLNLDGPIMDFDIHYVAGSPSFKGVITILGIFNVHSWPQEHSIREIFRDAYDRILRNVLRIIQDE